MCMFTLTPSVARMKGGVSVGRTSIFARLTSRGTQVTVYQMQYSAPEPVAMVLPVPVARNTEDALHFINLEHAASLFAELDALLDVARRRRPAKLSARADTARRPTLRVYDVGAYGASFVPSRDAFDRLDARLRLPKDVWARFPGYGDFGFAVFQLKAGTGADVHPMAFEFDTRERQRAFFPTVHVHDGTVHDMADFKHDLYCQGATEPPVDVLFKDGKEVDRRVPYSENGRPGGSSAWRQRFVAGWIEPFVQRQSPGEARFGTVLAEEGETPHALWARDTAVGRAIELGVVDASQRIDGWTLSGPQPNRDILFAATAEGSGQPYRLHETFEQLTAETIARRRPMGDGIDHLEIV